MRWGRNIARSCGRRLSGLRRQSDGDGRSSRRTGRHELPERADRRVHSRTGRQWASAHSAKLPRSNLNVTTARALTCRASRRLGRLLSGIVIGISVIWVVAGVLDPFARIGMTRCDVGGPKGSCSAWLGQQDGGIRTSDRVIVVHLGLIGAGALKIV